MEAHFPLNQMLVLNLSDLANQQKKDCLKQFQKLFDPNCQVEEAYQMITFFPSTKQFALGLFQFILLVVISILIGLYRSAVPTEVEFKYHNQLIKIIFGNIFNFDGYKVIPVSRYFFETNVLQESLQGQLIGKFQNSGDRTTDFQPYVEALETALQEIDYQEKSREKTGEQERYYHLGTTAILSLEGEKYILFSLTETELEGYIPNNNCDVSKMWEALEKFWESALFNAQVNAINIPLIGSGVTGISLNPSQILELNLLAIADAIETKGRITTKEIRIIIYNQNNNLKEINLNDFKNIWS